MGIRNVSSNTPRPETHAPLAPLGPWFPDRIWSELHHLLAKHGPADQHAEKPSGRSMMRTHSRCVPNSASLFDLDVQLSDRQPTPSLQSPSEQESYRRDR